MNGNAPGGGGSPGGSDGAPGGGDGGGGGGAGRRGLDLAAVGAGLLAGLAVVVPLFAIQLGLAVGSDDPADAWVAILLLGFVLAFGAGGYRAARRAGHRHLAHGAWGALAVFAAWIPLRLAVAVVADGDEPLAGVLTGAALAVLAGMAGGVLVLRRESRPGAGPT